MSNNNKIAVGLDIGTTKVCAVVLTTENESAGIYKIVGFSSTQSTGIRRGVISNIEKTSEAIGTVIADVQQKTGIKIDEVVVGIAGDHIDAISEISTVIISNPNQIVTENDVTRAIDYLRQSKISADRKIIHIVPYEYIIDGQDGITQPVGMYGTRLQANVHVVTGIKTAVQNISLCVDNQGLVLNDVVLEPIASSLALLNDDEKEVGVCLIDIGGGTTDITIFKDDVLRFTSEVAVGGNNLTEDIKKFFKITRLEAERIKCDYGHAFKGAILKRNESIMIKSVGPATQPREIEKEELCDLIQRRLLEVFRMCRGEIEKSGFINDLGAGIVLTGGTALLKGVDDLAMQVFDIPVHIGYPSGDKYVGLSSEIENPIYSTAVGLALHSLKSFSKSEISKQQEQGDSYSTIDANKEEYAEEQKKDTVMGKVLKWFDKW